MKNKFFQGVLLILIIILIGACPNTIETFNPEIVEKSKDLTNPTIEITSPDPDSEYPQTVTVTGSVSDDGGELPRLIYSVKDALGNHTKTGDISPVQVSSKSGVKGDFSFSFTTSEYSTDILLNIIATDWNGNVSENNTLRLVYPGNRIPSFTVNAGNKEVSLSWESVDGAASYDVYYTTDGSLPNENYGESIKDISEAYTSDNPLVITGLVNGKPHVFKLIAASEDNSTSWASAYITVIPISRNTFTPKVYSGYKKIDIEWPYISDRYSFQVYRGEGIDGTPINISGDINRNSFTDAQVEDGVDYYYYIKPALSEAGLSNGTAGRVFPLVDNNRRTLSTITDITNKITDIADSGSYAILVDGYGSLYVYNTEDPENPEYTGKWSSGNSSYSSDTSITVSGNYAYISYFQDIYILDITTKSSPQLLFQKEILTTDYNYFADIQTRSGHLYATSTRYSYDASGSDEGIYSWTINSSTGDITQDWFSGFDFNIGNSNIGFDRNGTGDMLVTYKNSSNESGVLKISTSDGTITDFISAQTTYTYTGTVINETEDTAVCIYYDTTGYFLSAYSYSGGTAIGDPISLYERGYNEGYFTDNILFLNQYSTLSAVRIDSSAASGTACGVILYSVSLNSGASGLANINDLSVCSIETGIQIIETKRKDSSVLKFSSGDTSAASVCVNGDRVYVGKSSGNLITIYSFENPSSPVELGTFSDLTGPVYDMKISGNYLYLSAMIDSTPGLYVFDVSDPDSIRHVETVEPGGTVNGFDTYGEMLALITNYGLVDIMDISDPENISRISRTRVSTSGNDIELSGGYFFAGSSSGLSIYDISDPSFPEAAGENTALVIQQLSISGDKLYYYSDTDELGVVDISDLSNPAKLMGISCIINGSDPLFASGLDSSGDYVFFHGWPDGDNYDDDGFQIFNTANTQIEDRLEFYPENDASEGDIVLNGRYMYIAAGDFKCFDIDP